MGQRELSGWIKAIILFTAFMGLVTYAWIVFIHSLYNLSNLFTGNLHVNVYWAVFITVCAVPCYIALVYAWKIANQIKLDNSFSHINAKYMKRIAALAVADSIMLFVGYMAFWAISTEFPHMVVAVIFVALAGLILAIVATCLSHLIEKAAIIKDDNDGIV